MTFSFAAILLLCLATASSSALFSERSPKKNMDRYLASLSSEIVDKLLTKVKDFPVDPLMIDLPEPPSPHEIPSLPLRPGVTLAAPNTGNPERKLTYESLTSSYLMGDNDDTSTTNHLSMLISQQKAMQNYRVVGNWLNDLENNLDDLRDAVNRRVSDLATGLQRRNQLLGHYNYIGQGMGIGGPGFSNPQMNNFMV